MRLTALIEASIAVGLFLTVGAAFISAASGSTSSYSMSVTSDSSSYFPGQAISVTGSITPAPGPDTGALIEVTNPSGTIVLIGEADVNPDTGAFSFGAVAGGTPSWTTGTYTINATWGAYGPAISCSSTFGYGTSVTPVKVCTAQVTTTTTTSSSASSTTTSSSSTTSTTAVPEFQAALAPAVLLFVLGATALILGQRHRAASGIRLALGPGDARSQQDDI